MFPVSHAREVTSAMRDLLNDNSWSTAGQISIMTIPSVRNLCLVIAARYTGDGGDAPTSHDAIYDLEPVVANGKAMPIQNAERH